MASSIRSWWASTLISRPMTRSTTSMTISPIRAAASSTARWRARPTSASALATMRSYSLWPRRLGVGAHLLGGALGLGDDLTRLVPRLLEHGPPLVVGRLGVGLGLVGGLERAPDLLLALLHRLVDGGQHALVMTRITMIEDDQLHEERPVGEEEYAWLWS